jgi:hypothetical protein
MQCHRLLPVTESLWRLRTAQWTLRLTHTWTAERLRAERSNNGRNLLSFLKVLILPLKLEYSLLDCRLMAKELWEERLTPASICIVWFVGCVN